MHAALQHLVVSSTAHRGLKQRLYAGMVDNGNVGAGPVVPAIATSVLVLEKSPCGPGTPGPIIDVNTPIRMHNTLESLRALLTQLVPSVLRVCVHS